MLLYAPNTKEPFCFEEISINHTVIMTCDFKADSSKPHEISNAEFLNEIYQYAWYIHLKYDIPFEVIVAQAALESGYKIPDNNNIFNIKCHSDWNENRSYKWDDESTISCFRVYPNVYSAFEAYGKFLHENSRYKVLFESNDPVRWAHGLQKAGFATDKSYAYQLISIMRKWKLL